MSKTIKWVIAVIVVIIIVVGAWYFGTVTLGTPVETGPIKIGFIGPLTGDASSLGQDARDAVVLATKEINDKGGINGKKLEVIYEDGKCDGVTAANAVSKLINIDKVNAIVGGACSSETLAFTNMAEQAKVPVLSYCSSAPGLTTVGDYIFRNVPSDAYQGRLAADYIFNTLKKKTVAVVYQQTEWGAGIDGVFVGEFKKLGGQVVLDEGFDNKTRDFKTQLTKVAATKPEVLYFVSYAEPAVVALKQISEVGLKMQVFGADAWSDPKILQLAGKNAEGIMFATLASSKNEDFIKKFQKATGRIALTECGAPAYDALNIMAEAFTKAGGINPEAVKNALYQTDYKGGAAYNETKFDSNGDLIGAQYSIDQIKNGKVVEAQL